MAGFHLVALVSGSGIVLAGSLTHCYGILGHLSRTFAVPESTYSLQVMKQSQVMFETVFDEFLIQKHINCLMTITINV